MKPVKFMAVAAFALCSATLWSQTVNIYSYSVPSGGYEPNGNLTNYTDSTTGTWSTQYDGLNRLTSATSTAGVYNGLNIAWGYDSFGNRLNQTPTGSNASLPPATTMRYDDGTNRITSSSIGVDSSAYDEAGNLRYDGLNHIAYDAENRVCAVQNYSGSITQYLYNAEGQRVAKGHSASGAGLVCPTPGDFVATEKYILGPSGEQITQLSTQPNGSDVWQHTNVYANGQLIATYDQEGSQQLLHFQVSDALGTRRVQTSASGSVELAYSNLPYGDGFTLNGSGEDATQQHFTGKERDSESGNDYFGARYYGSSMGRFMSPDEPFYSGDLTDPQKLNLYSYVGNNPLSRVDPDGHDYHICVDNGNGGQNCFNLNDDQFNALVKQQNGQQGINFNGGFPSGSISCGGSTCGSFSYFEKGLVDESGGELAGIALGGVIGKAAGAAWDAVAGFFGRGAGEAAGEVVGETAGAAKSTVQDILQGATPEGGSRAAIYSKPGGIAQATKDFNALDGTATKAGNVMIKDLPNGQGRAVLRTDPSTWSNGRPSLDIQPSGGGYKSTAIRYNQ